MSRTPILGRISKVQERIAELAREDRERSFLSLAHHIDTEKGTLAVLSQPRPPQRYRVARSGVLPDAP